MSKTVLKTAAFGSVCGCVVYVGARTAVTAEDWDAYLAYLAPLLTAGQVLPRVVWDDSGGPSPRGRQKLTELTQNCVVKVALVGDAAVARNVVTVLNWNRQEESYRTFASTDLRQAIAFIGISGHLVETVVSSLFELRSDLGFTLSRGG